MRNRSFLCACLALLLTNLVGGGTQAGPAPNLLDYNGGPVLRYPAIHNLYMDTSWDFNNPAAVSRNNIDALTVSLVNSNYLASASQYGVGAASFTGSHQTSGLCPAPIVAGITDFLSIGTWLGCMTAPALIPWGTATGIPVPNANTVYTVYVPSGTQINDVLISSCGNFWAYHFSGSALVWKFAYYFLPVLVSQTFAYTVVPMDCAAQAQTYEGLPNLIDGVSFLASHEIAEASTDPIFPTGWINNSTAGLNTDILTAGEANDICAVRNAPAVQMTNGLFVSAYWSNADNACVPIAGP